MVEICAAPIFHARERLAWPWTVALASGTLHLLNGTELCDRFTFEWRNLAVRNPVYCRALLATGLWTAILAGITGGIELWTAFTDASGRDAHLLAAAIALGLAVLGPGAWSIDARLFGRKRLIPRR